MAQPGRTFRIFVSSTFEDLKEERNALQERVFPKLRELCMQYGCRFQAIDLRWGVSEEASLDQQTVKICLEEIKRCRKVTPRPNFIVLLGDRYGWRPLPYEIPASEFKEIERHITDVEEKRLLNTWYKRDDNAVPPVYCLQRRTGKPVIANGVKQSPQPADYEDHAIWEKKVERPLRMALLNAVNKIDCFGQDPRNDDSSPRNVNEGGMSQSSELANGKQFPQSVIASETKQSPTIDRLKYIASATEQEIVHGALTVPDANEHVFCFFRKINDLPVTPPPLVGQPSPVVTPPPPPMVGQPSPLVIKTNDFIDLDEYGNPDKDASALLDNLKARLRTRLPGNIHEYNSDWKDGRITTSHIEKLCDDVYQSLSRVILREIEQFKDIDPLEKEITDHYEFGKKLTAFFVGRAAVRKTIQDYVKSNARHPLVIYGESGSGKSAVMAQTISDCGMRMADYTVVSRFIGATPTSSDGRSLLEGLCLEISRRYGADQTNIPKEYRELVQEFTKRLALATKEKPLIVFLDALDQLSDTDYARNLVWLPSELSENVSVVVSTLPGECLTALENKLSANNLAQHNLNQVPSNKRGFRGVSKNSQEEKFLAGDTIIKLEPMPQAEGEALLDAWLEDAGRRLQNEQWADILKKFKQNGLPLYLKLAFEEARRWKSYDGLPGGADKEPGLNKDVPGVIRDLFSRLSLESNHGRALVSHCLSYLAAAKNGLTEDEMLDVLSRKEEIIKDFQRRSPKSPPVKNSFKN